jgi:lipoprotein-releasing system ATP-binding protein
MNNLELLRVEKLSKIYTTGRGELTLFSGLDFSLQVSEMAAVIGQSGAGKSTLLHLLAALDKPTSGSIYFENIDLQQMDAAEYRNKMIGYVWQFHYLLPEFTALENAAMPLMARGLGRKPAMEQAAHWLGEVGLKDRVSHRAGELSGGEQQRVALARALVTRPKLLLADELTGDLDNATGEVIFELLQRLHAEHGLTTLLVTHNKEFAARCGRIFRLHSGKMEVVGI